MQTSRDSCIMLESCSQSCLGFQLFSRTVTIPLTDQLASRVNAFYWLKALSIPCICHKKESFQRKGERGGKEGNWKWGAGK